MGHDHATILTAVQAIARGEIVIVADAEDRENEGDFICAAEYATAAAINFMITYGRGLVCVALPATECRRLDLPPMVENNTSSLRTAFTVSVDHRTCKTGITAQERAATVRALADPASTSTSFVRPGHVFPLTAAQGGVLTRAGHTECALDLSSIAGLRPAGVLCEILNAKGDRANRDQLLAIAHEHSLELITVEDLVAYQRTVTRS